MRYVLRADGLQSIESGHVMRCSAIAEELVARGEDVLFFIQISDLLWVKKRIDSLGFTGIYKNAREFISSSASNVLVLDSYEITIDDAFIAHKRKLHIVAIVKESTPNYRCDLRMHAGLDSTWVGESKIPILAGPKYIPFRVSLSQNMTAKAKGKGRLKIAVVAGGSYPYKLVFK